MNESRIRLPANAVGEPDWPWMRQFILGQNFSAQLYEDEADTAIAKERLAEIASDPQHLIHGEELQSRLNRIAPVRSAS
jgi:hypothetical protein